MFSYLVLALQAAAPPSATDIYVADLLVLDGAFAVKAEGGNKFLELPGAPLDTYGLLFGPTVSANIAAVRMGTPIAVST